MCVFTLTTCVFTLTTCVLHLSACVLCHYYFIHSCDNNDICWNSPTSPSLPPVSLHLSACVLLSLLFSTPMMIMIIVETRSLSAHPLTHSLTQLSHSSHTPLTHSCSLSVLLSLTPWIWMLGYLCGWHGTPLYDSWQLECWHFLMCFYYVTFSW